MTVLRVNSSDRYASPRPGGLFADSGRQSPRPVPVSCQMQDWTRRMEISSTDRHAVISEKRTALPVFSAKGIRWDVLTAFLLLLFLLFAGILLSDMGALYAGGERIGRLSSGIISLEDTNSQLRQVLSAALNHPALLSKSESMNEVNETLIVLSAVPAE